MHIITQSLEQYPLRHWQPAKNATKNQVMWTNFPASSSRQPAEQLRSTPCGDSASLTLLRCRTEQHCSSQRVCWWQQLLEYGAVGSGIESCPSTQIKLKPVFNI